MIAICTACTPWYPLLQLLPRLAVAGYDGVEIGVKPHAADPARAPNCWSNNHAVISVEALTALLPQLDEQLRAQSLRLAAIGSYHGAHEASVHRQFAVIARRLGCGLIRATVPVHDASRGYAAQLAEQRAWWRELAAIGAGEGVRFCIELHDHTMTPSASAALRVLDGLPSAGVGVIFDVANTVAEGNEGLPMAIDMLGSLLVHVHVKQRTMQRLAQPHRGSLVDCAISPLPQPGDIVWPDVIAMLRTAGYRGWYSVEDFTRLDRADERLAADAAWMRAVLAQAG